MTLLRPTFLPAAVFMIAACSISICAAQRVTDDSLRSAQAQSVLDEEGFQVLFNGKDLEGWIGATDGYGVENGVIYCKPESGGNLYTKDQFSDFTFRFEFKLESGSNNGLGIRTPPKGDAAYVGMELQILDNTADQYANLKDYQYHGSIYGVAPAKRGFLKPVGEWNTQEVVCHMRHITVKLNGETIVDVDLDEVAPEGKTVDGNDHPGLANAEGHIGFLGHGSRVEFRNIRVRDDSPR